MEVVGSVRLVSGRRGEGLGSVERAWYTGFEVPRACRDQAALVCGWLTGRAGLVPAFIRV